MQPKFRAPNQQDALDTKKLYRDTRTTWRQLTDAFQQPIFMGITLMGMTGFMVFEPAFCFWLFPVSYWMYRSRSKKLDKQHLPFRLPFAAGITDYNDPIPGRKKFFQSSGAFFLGNTFGDNRTELWLSIRDLLTHMLIFGTTGSGKTEALISLAFNSLAMGSGLFYVDPKGSPKLIAQLFTMSRIVGRECEFRCINYLTAEKAAAGTKMPLRTTNTCNPFAYGNAESLANMMNSLLPKADGNNSIFSANAQNLMRSTMYALVELRDKGEIQLSVKTIRDYLTLTNVMKLADRTDLSENTTAAIRAFLTSVGWQQGKIEKDQPKSLPEQFGYARSYFGAPLNNLTDTFGHIYGTPFGEVDMRDIVLNRRILAVVIPSLALDEGTTKALGVLALSSIRIAISVGLGSGKEGSFADALEALPTDAPSPFLSITDEYAAIPTPGYVEVLTQGRGLGISAIVASQDYAGITKADKEGAEQLLANTKLKLFMKGTVHDETFEVAKKLAGEITMMETTGYSINRDSSAMTSDYRDTLSTNTKERSKIHLADIQDQIEGEFHAFFGSSLVRGMTFYANPPLKSDSQFHYNHMVAISPPKKSDLKAKYGQSTRLVAHLLDCFNGLPAITADQTASSRIAAQEQLAIAHYEQLYHVNNEACPGFVELIRETLDKPLGSKMDTMVAAFMRYQNQDHLVDITEFMADEDSPSGTPMDDLYDFLGENPVKASVVSPSVSHMAKPSLGTSSSSESPARRSMLSPVTPSDESPYLDGVFEFPDDPMEMPISQAIETNHSEATQAIMALRSKALGSGAPTTEGVSQDAQRIRSALSKAKGEAVTSAAKPSVLSNLSESILERYPRQPVPEDNKKKRDFLSQRLTNVIQIAQQTGDS